MTPPQLAALLEEAILKVIDVEAYERELAQEQKDLKAIARDKRMVLGRGVF